MEDLRREFHPEPTNRNLGFSVPNTSPAYNDIPISPHFENQMYFNENDWSQDTQSWNPMPNRSYVDSGEILNEEFNRLCLSPLPPQRVLFDHRGLEWPTAVSDGRNSEYQQFRRMLMQMNPRGEMMAGGQDRFGNFLRAPQIFLPDRKRVNQPRMSTTSYLNNFRSCFNARRTRDAVKISKPMHTSPVQNLSMQEMKGRVLLLAKDQHGCLLLQKILDEGTEHFDMIFYEVKDHIHELMIDQFGNNLVQKILETSPPERMSDILASIATDIQRFAQVCLDSHGTKVVQMLLKFLQTPEQIAFAISAIQPITVALIKSINGGHVIEQCVDLFTFAHTKPLLDVVADNCLELATDRRGCCTLQHCLTHARGEAAHILVNEIIAYSLCLSENPYGNYVVQYIVGLKIPPLTKRIIAQLCGRYVQLSINKFGSNVVEVLLKTSPHDLVKTIVIEISTSDRFLNVLQDPYGNFVVQTALRQTKGAPGGVHKMLTDKVMFNYAFIHSHLHGKRVLTCIRDGRSFVNN